MVIIAMDDEKLLLMALTEAIREASPEAEIHSFRKKEELEAFLEEHQADVAFLDIQMRGISGVNIAKFLKKINPQINIIFTTGYSEYQTDAFAMHASGYIIKPVSAEKIKEELDNLRYPVQSIQGKRIRFQTFGNFEAYLDGVPMKFKYDKTKELLAYLVNRRGALCSFRECMAVLWEEEHSSYFSNIRSDLLHVLKEADQEEILVKQKGKLGIVRDMVDCDLYDWLDGKPSGINAYQGEYMVQYSWSEYSMSDFF